MAKAYVLAAKNILPICLPNLVFLHKRCCLFFTKLPVLLYTLSELYIYAVQMRKFCAETLEITHTHTLPFQFLI